MSTILGIRDIEHYHWQVAEADSPFRWPVNGNSLSLPAAIELACIDALKETLPSSAITIKNCPIWKLVKAARWPGRRTGKTKLRDGSIAVLVLPSDASDP